MYLSIKGIFLGDKLCNAVFRKQHSCSLHLSSVYEYAKAVKYKKASPHTKANAKKQWNWENKKMFGPVSKSSNNDVRYIDAEVDCIRTRKEPSKEFFLDAPLPSVELEPTASSGMISIIPNKKPECDSVSDAPTKLHEKATVKPKFSLRSLLQFPLSPTDKHLLGSLNVLEKPLTTHDDALATAYPSVSRILKQSQPPEMAIYLEKWQQKMIKELGEEGFAQHQQETLDRGEVFHEAVSQVLVGVPAGEVAVAAEAEALWRSISHVLPDFHTAHHVEAAVQHPYLHYRGKFDCVAEYKGRLCLIDWKSSKKQKKTLASTYDNPLQIAAYVGAFNFDESYETKIENGLLVVAYEDGSPADVHSIPGRLCKYYWGHWLRRLRTYWLAVLAGETQVYSS